MMPRPRPQRPAHPRRRILEEVGLALAPIELQQCFWMRHNRARRLAWRQALPAGDVANSILAGLSPVDGLAAAWRAVVPAALADASRVLALQNGTLKVVVDGNASRFAVQRLLGPGLAERLNEHLGEKRVARIDCQIQGRGRRGEWNRS